MAGRRKTQGFAANERSVAKATIDRVPRGIRTPVTAVKGRCPGPLDDGDAGQRWWSQTGSNRRPLACHASALPAELWPHARRAKLRNHPWYVKNSPAIRTYAATPDYGPSNNKL